MTGAEANTSLLNQLRELVRAQGGDWNTQRVVDALDGWPTHRFAGELLDKLADERLLVRRGVLWTPPQPTDLPSFTKAIAERIRTIPGVTFAELGEDAGLIGVRHTGGSFFVEVWPGRAPEPTLTDAEQREYRREQDDHIHDEDADEQVDDETEEQA